MWAIGHNRRIYSRDGHLYHGEGVMAKLLETREEKDVFRYLGLDFTPPERREVKRNGKPGV